jgi:hypothetical protein
VARMARYDALHDGTIGGPQNEREDP